MNELQSKIAKVFRYEIAAAHSEEVVITLADTARGVAAVFLAADPAFSQVAFFEAAGVRR